MRSLSMAKFARLPIRQGLDQVQHRDRVEGCLILRRRRVVGALVETRVAAELHRVEPIGSAVIEHARPRPIGVAGETRDGKYGNRVVAELVFVVPGT